MTDPVTTIAAGAILNLAFEEFAKSGAGEVAKKTVEGSIALAKKLRDQITARFKGNGDILPHQPEYRYDVGFLAAR